MEMHKGQILDSLPSDVDRARQCALWAEDSRNKWFQGQREMVEDVLLSTSWRYRGLGAREREIIGRRKWTNCAKNKELADAEQMYTRWAGLYLGLAGLK